ncbi:MAG: hypothetical protein N2450_05560 [bacterium]|nr:hypothetical protein [bacterium]
MSECTSVKVSNFLIFIVLSIPLNSFASEGLEIAPYGECTLALLRPERTTDGRMLIWKNRDVSERNNVVRILQGTTYRFVGIGYGNVSNEVWGGVNTAGFAIANSNIWNMEPLLDPPDDGTIQTRALGTCNSLSQFRQILNETDTLNGGRTNPSCFFAFDSSGEMSVFEAGRNNWWEFPLTANDPNGFLVRANYGYIADTTNNPLGFYRNHRARQFYQNAVNAGLVPLDSVFRIMRDIAPEGWNNLYYPIPYDGYHGSYPYAFSSMYGSICRRNTASAIVIQGGKWHQGQWLMPVVWFFLGNPITTLGVPVWPHQPSLSLQLQGTSITYAPICSQANAIYDNIDGPSMSIDTRFLTNESGGWLQYLYTIETTIRTRSAYYLTNALTPQQYQAFSDSIADLVYNALNNYRAPRTPSNVTISFSSGSPVLQWSAVTRDFRNRTLPQGTSIRYRIYRSPFGGAQYTLRYQLFGETTSTSFSIPLETSNYYSFYVKAVSE